MIIYDQIQYEDGATLPDLGGLVNKGTATDREYWGPAADATKLPTKAKYPQYKGYLDTGSLFIATDSKLVKVYTASTDAWTERG